MSQYKRVLIKLSGEFLSGEKSFGIDHKMLSQISEGIKQAYESGTEIGIVVGGGNIFRGVAGATKGMDRAQSDYMGMLATVINSLALQDRLEQLKVPTRVLSAISMSHVAEMYIRRRAIRHLEKKRVIICAAGTGNPYFTTDTAAALRAMEINAELLIKATSVDGVYHQDPKTHKDAKMFKTLSYMDVLNKGLKVMDSTAVSLCMDNKLPIVTLNLNDNSNIKKAINKEEVGTLIS